MHCKLKIEIVLVSIIAFLSVIIFNSHSVKAENIKEVTGSLKVFNELILDKNNISQSDLNWIK